MKSLEDMMWQDGAKSVRGVLGAHEGGVVRFGSGRARRVVVEAGSDEHEGGGLHRLVRASLILGTGAQFPSVAVSGSLGRVQKWGRLAATLAPKTKVQAWPRKSSRRSGKAGNTIGRGAGKELR